jgi:glycosyltransferase involved in cell wall biosynthesis
MYRGKTISVVMPAYNEANGIARVIADFRRLPEVDDIIVVDNASTDDTAHMARQAGARVVHESKKGYGNASKTALLTAITDYVVITESDGTFRAADLYKFLTYASEFDVVFGTRTSKTCIWSGANMGWFLRYGNWAVAKLLEYLHNGPCLTDVGCTYKLLRRESMRDMVDHLTVGGSHFSPELMLAAIRSGLRCVEIPVHYRPRIGASKITGDFHRAFRLGLTMIGLIIVARLRSYARIESAVASELLQEIEGAVSAFDSREKSASASAR